MPFWWLAVVYLARNSELGTGLLEFAPNLLKSLRNPKFLSSGRRTQDSGLFFGGFGFGQSGGGGGFNGWGGGGVGSGREVSAGFL